MTQVAFYAPLKPPTHPVASGDRAMARALMAALERGGATVDLASSFQSRDGVGDPALQARKIGQAAAEAETLIDTGKSARWQVWITYHNYYKAPDLIGPTVASALGIPYMLVEATRARKRLGGPWDAYARTAEAATDAAQAVFYLTHRDAEALRAYGDPLQRLIHLRPFLARTDLPQETSGTGGMLSVGMFRMGDKLESYILIAESLAQVRAANWHLTIAGDGPARAEVHALFAPFEDHITYLGAADAADMAAAYSDASVLLWPGVNEAFGMTYLEAQAAGLAVVAQDRPGVRDVLGPSALQPAPDDGPAAVAAALDRLLARPEECKERGLKARRHIANHHLIDQAARTLADALAEVLQ